MAASPAPRDSRLMDISIFEENFGDNKPHKACLCYEVEPPEGDSRIPVDKLKGYLLNKPADTPGGPRHAELCFLDLICSWDLDKERHYKVTLLISWTPCSDCAQQLVTFLGQNSHVSLRVFAARIYAKYENYKEGLCQLQAAETQIAIMDFTEYKHCWDNFVDHKGDPFQPWPALEKHIRTESQQLEDILRGN